MFGTSAVLALRHGLNLLLKRINLLLLQLQLLISLGKLSAASPSGTTRLDALVSCCHVCCKCVHLPYYTHTYTDTDTHETTYEYTCIYICTHRFPPAFTSPHAEIALLGDCQQRR